MATNKRLIKSNDEVQPIVPTDNFTTITYTGNGGTQSTNSLLNQVGSVDFQPDFTWIKVRNTTNDHTLQNSISGTSKFLRSSTTGAEGSNIEMVTSYNSNGFTLGPNALVNQSSSQTYVAWCWKAGGNTSTYNIDDVGYATASAAGLDSGTINPTGASVNTAAGFSIVKYITPSGGAGTVGHGLSSAPEVYITKRLDSSSDWYFNTTAIDGSLDYLLLNSGAQKTDSSGISSPTSTVFSASNFGTQNEQWIAYCFHSVVGYQKVGSYTSPLSIGTKITTGFRPRFLLIKADRANNSWHMWDSVRDTTNPRDKVFRPNTSLAELDGSVFNIDFVDDGFEIENTYESINHTTATNYIYLAIA